MNTQIFNVDFLSSSDWKLVKDNNSALNIFKIELIEICTRKYEKCRLNFIKIAVSNEEQYATGFAF